VFPWHNGVGAIIVIVGEGSGLTVMVIVDEVAKHCVVRFVTLTEYEPLDKIVFACELELVIGVPFIVFQR
jgi:CheY-specific phosphatase CheX